MTKVALGGRAGGRLRRPWRRQSTKDAAVPDARPRLWPAARWAQAALLLLLVFTLLRGVLVGITIPHFWGPDEDYHFLYAEYLTTQHALPSPDKDLYPPEYPTAVQAINYDGYCCAIPPDGLFRGDPKAAVKATSDLPRLYREPSHAGRGVGVVHPPLYQTAAALVNAAGGNASVLTRVTWVRFLTAVFGVLAVYAAWLLASQVLRQPHLQLLSAFLVAVQPMIAFLAGIVNHDSALIAFTTLALGMLAFIVRSRPRTAQGAWLGAALVLALLVKGSALALLPLAAGAYLLQWLTNRDAGRDVLRSAGLALGLVAVFAAWWYVRSQIVYGSATGSTTPIASGGDAAAAPQSASLGELLRWAGEWTGLTYRTYWFHYMSDWGPGPAFLKYIPVWLGGAGALGLVHLALQRGRRLMKPDAVLLRQLLLLLAAVLAFYLPFVVVDVARRADGLPFYVNGGRYLLPAYAAVVVLFVAGVRELVRPAAQTLVFLAIGVVALAFGVRVYLKWQLWFYLGQVEIGELFRRMTFNRPAFVTEGFVWVLVLLIALSLVGFTVALWRGRRATTPLSSA